MGHVVHAVSPTVSLYVSTAHSLHEPLVLSYPISQVSHAPDAEYVKLVADVPVGQVKHALGSLDEFTYCPVEQYEQILESVALIAICPALAGHSEQPERVLV